MKTFLANWNPDQWAWDDDVRIAAATITEDGGLTSFAWSFGNRKHGVTAGVDRVFLLRLGQEPKGVVASGWIDSEPYEDFHWDGTPGKMANYVKVSWDCVLRPDETPLPLSVLAAEIPAVDWSPQGGGVELPDAAASELQRLWSAQTGEEPFRGTFGVGQRWQTDPMRRRLVEDHAQSLLESYYRERDWEVTDDRHGHPYDAVARKDGDVLYLEAKGTETDGTSVLVTRGEVDWALGHPGQCKIGIVHDVRFDADGLPTGGTLKVQDWDPGVGALAPTAYEWTPPTK